MAVSSATTAVNNERAGVLQDAAQISGRVRAIPFTYEKLATNTNGDRIQLARLKSDWVVLGITFYNDALTGATSVQLGLYEDKEPTTAAAIDADCYASSVDISSGLSGTNLAFEARNIDKMGQRVWQDGGLAAAPTPGTYYALALTLTTGGTATGTISGYVLVSTG